MSRTLSSHSSFNLNSFIVITVRQPTWSFRCWCYTPNYTHRAVQNTNNDANTTLCVGRTFALILKSTKYTQKRNLQKKHAKKKEIFDKADILLLLVYFRVSDYFIYAPPHSNIQVRHSVSGGYKTTK